MNVIERIKGAETVRSFNINRSVVFGVALLLLLSVAGTLLVPQFGSYTNLRSMLLLAAFLGLASLGQTLCALLGGVDLSIPYVIGSSNIMLAALLSWGVPWPVACLMVLVGGIVVGILNGALSFRLQGQSLIMTMGVGLAVVGACQIYISIGSVYGGTVQGDVPEWLRDLSSIAGTTFGLPIPPVVVIWIALAAVVVTAMSNTSFGRSFYAVGGNRLAASRILISEYRTWLIAYAISGAMSALTGMALLGFAGGGFVGVGDPYLFTTIAAVVIGGTSLMGGWGGYGSTIVGTLALTLLTTLLVGLGLSFAMQQAVFGLLIVPIVALYARDRSMRDKI
ncbi:ABC transporter permease [Mesorhizobium sp. M3A.F.Ca.ET.201.01.1.1]|uniref:ABC transporter permease n=1 Tax=Mesorhizobium sp. M3A.F.Ca.ET.201.01.1.1 TaxID=2563946 RepID=UPI001093C2F0|nr:ABC transporter permease [Mesorhizobium sp. M3A.F.Ca.ET.201.01.1.1]TGS65574.1 ABC transporter permease [Mesorhizobium sp. M3A.F.Ca.ET.201.01.1.1]